MPRAFAMWNDQLVAGGGFGAAPPISRWVGNAWTPMGSSFDGPVYALIEYNGILYAAGDFTNAGGVSALSIAWWNGFSWQSAGSGLKGEVRTLAIYQDRLIAGGDFDIPGETVGQNIAAWNGELWSPLGK
ncbi:MAG: hypothetical protein GY953_03580 [bacterium]|nr:hypothetical protein [bacterium]